MIRKKPNNTPKKFQTKVVQKKKKQTNKQKKTWNFQKKKTIKKIEIVILIINYYHIARARATWYQI